MHAVHMSCVCVALHHIVAVVMVVGMGSRGGQRVERRTKIVETSWLSKCVQFDSPNGNLLVTVFRARFRSHGPSRTYAFVYTCCFWGQILGALSVHLGTAHGPLGIQKVNPRSLKQNEKVQKVEHDFTCHEHALTHVPTSRHVAYRKLRRTSVWKPVHKHRQSRSHSSRVLHYSGEEVYARLRTCTFRSLNLVTLAIDLPKAAPMCRTRTVRPSNLDSEDAASRCGFVQRRACFRCERHSCSHILRQH